MFVTKASGKKEEFMPEKISRSLMRAGASKKLATEIVKQVEAKAYDGITTREILDMALKILSVEKPHVSERYDLKRGIMNLGPAGFVFEKFFAEILKNYGYETQVGQMIKGRLSTHEIDIVAKKKYLYMVECKYHNSLGVYTDLKVALYTYARFLDLKNKFDFPWIVTNTRVSDKAMSYSKGVGIKLTSWSYPEKESLRDLITQKKLYPVTILRSVDAHVKWKLSVANIFFARDLLELSVQELKERTKLKDSVLRSLISDAKGVLRK